MPNISTVFEREILDLSRAALQLERLSICSDSIPAPVRYQQILKRLSELHRRWQEHKVHQGTQISKFFSDGGELFSIVHDWDEPSIDEPSINVEQQLKAISNSCWPRSAEAGLSSIRVSVTGILHLLYQQIARERSTCATLIHRRRTSMAKIPVLV
jgi:hypothetical protein